MIFIEEKDERFYIDVSSIPNAGYGVFAKVPIKKGDWMEIVGILVKRGGIADVCTHYARRYKFSGKTNDAKIVPMGYAGIVNYIDDPKKQNCEIKRIPGLKKKNEHSSEMVYYFIRDIGVGEEILGNYGERMGGEVKQLIESTEYVEKNQSDWEEFLNFNLYDLKRVLSLF
jgi:SET domain-containing protein